MNKLEQMGMELALLLRRQAEARAVWDEVTEKIGTLCEQITTEPTGTLYGSQTGEHFQVERNAVGWSVTSSAPPEQAKPRNQAPVPMARPMRPGTEHLDGGGTFAFNPIADHVAQTVTMPAVLQCPRTTGGQCPELSPHIHTADGIQRVADIGS